MVADFESELRRLITEVFGTPSEDEGCPPGEIEAAETRLGVSLPGVLRACYRVAGRHRAFSEGMQNLPALPCLRIAGFRTDDGAEDVGLVFLVERQGAYFSVIRQETLSENDPPVFQGNIDSDKLYLECLRLSSILLKALCWNAIQVLPWSGSAEDEPLDLEKLGGRLRVVESGPPEVDQPRMFQRGHFVACAFPKKMVGTYDLFVAAHEENDLDQFEREFGIQLSWN